jgi:hypothetical protein
MELTFDAIKAALREVLDAELGLRRLPAMPPKWQEGTLVFKPGDPSLAAREIPIETYLKKVTAVREKLRVLEQKLNNHPVLSLEEEWDSLAAEMLSRK